MPAASQSLLLYTRTMATAATAPAPEVEAPFFKDEPEGPDVKTEIPGPKTKPLIEKLERVFDVRSLNMMVDYDKSYAN